MTLTYYVPEISEFHVGFEYEQNLPNKEWRKEKLVMEYTLYDTRCSAYNCDAQHSIEKELEAGNIRVKHLDREDIEGEGWQLVNLGFVINEYSMKVNGKLYRMLHMPSKNIVGVTNLRKTSFSKILEGHTQFPSRLIALTILNLSEFRKLMKQLGIKKA